MALQKHVVVIPAGGSLSDAFDCKEGTIVAIGMPLAWTTANMSFQLSLFEKDAPYFDVFGPDGRELVRGVSVNGLLIGMRLVPGWLKLRSGTRERPIAQAQAREFTVVIDTAIRFSAP